MPVLHRFYCIYSHENKQDVRPVATIFQIVTVINSMHAVHFFMIFLSSAFFQNQVFRKSFQEYNLDVKGSVGPDLSPNCLQGYQETTKFAACRQRVKGK